MVIPSRRLAVAVAVTSPLWILSATRLGVAPALLALGLIIAAALSDFIRLPSVSHFHVERNIPQTGALGEKTALAYRVSSEWGAETHIRITELLPDGLAESSWRETGVPVPPLVESGKAIELIPLRRGVYALGAVGLRFDSPFGLLHRTARRVLPASITIAPSLSAAGRYRLLTLQHRLQLAGAHP